MRRGIMIADPRCSLSSHFRRSLWVFALSSLLLAACARPIDRPLSGAAPPDGDYTPQPVARADAPPTLAPATAIPFNPDRHDPYASQTMPTIGTVGLPVIRGVQPAPNAELPLGEVQVSASVQGFSKLVKVTATLNGKPVPVEVGDRDERSWTAFFKQKLAAGEHEVRMVALDDRGRSGNLAWRFTVSSPTATPRPSPIATPRPANTPRPTPTATRGPTPTATRAPASPTPARIEVPMVKGMRANEARDQLRGRGFQVQTREVKSPAPKGIVWDQSPEAGAIVPTGSAITLLVSEGK